MTFGKFAYHFWYIPTFLNAALDQLLECKLDVINQYLNHGIKVIAVAEMILAARTPPYYLLTYIELFSVWPSTID